MNIITVNTGRELTERILAPLVGMSVRVNGRVLAKVESVSGGMLYATAYDGAVQREWSFHDINTIEVMAAAPPIKVKVDSLGASETFNLRYDSDFYRFWKHSVDVTPDLAIIYAMKVDAKGELFLNRDDPESILRLTKVD